MSAAKKSGDLYAVPVKLPGGEKAIIPLPKIRDYCLNPDHPTGKHKARVFRAALNLTGDDAEELRDMLAIVAAGSTVSASEASPHGTKYTIDFEWKRSEKTAVIRSIWIILDKDDAPRLITCYVA